MPLFAYVKVTIDTAALDAYIAGAPAKAEKALEMTAAKCETDVKMSIQEQSIIDTGALFNSIEHERMGSLMYEVRDGVEYGIYQELGTRFIRARPFFIPSIEKNAGTLLDSMIGMFK